MKSAITMKDRVENYLKYRRNLGFALLAEGGELMAFAKYADAKGHRGALTTELATEWASSSKRASRLSWARRLEIVRCFAKFCRTIEPNTQIPPKAMFGPAHRRITPHIYSEQEISDLLIATQQLHPIKGLRPITFQFLFCLLVSTGLRISEALRLSRKDVDLIHGVLTIRETKFYKSRYVPLHATAIHALQEYSLLRDKCKPAPHCDKFFILDNGRSINIRQAQYSFNCLRSILGWHKTHHKKMPRLYDFRHTFVCRRLIAWYEEGKDINQVIPFLSTYLGHVKVANTYWYITGIPKLMAIATKRFEKFTLKKLED